MLRPGDCNDNERGLLADSNGTASKCAMVKEFCKVPVNGARCPQCIKLVVSNCKKTCGACKVQLRVPEPEASERLHNTFAERVKLYTDEVSYTHVCTHV